MVGVEVVVFAVYGDEAAEAESSQDSARALVLVGGEEGGAELDFEIGVEVGVDYDWLNRVGPP